MTLDATFLATISERGPIRWTDLPAGWLVALLVAATLIVVGALYRRERVKVSFPMRLLLNGLRVGALLLLLLALFGPFREEVRKAEDKSHLVILVDASASMKTVDTYPVDSERKILAAAYPESGPDRAPSSLTLSRFELSQRLLAGPGDRFLRALSERFVVHAFAFDEEVRSIGATDPSLSAAREGDDATLDQDLVAALGKAIRALDHPAGGRTRIGAALKAIAREFVGREDRRLAGVVLISDGRDNSDEAEKPGVVLSSLGKAAEDLRVTAVALGDEKSGKDLRVDRVVAKDWVLVQDEVTFRPELRQTGFTGVRGVAVSMKITQVAGPDGVAFPSPVVYNPRPSASAILSQKVDLLGEDRATPALLRAQFDVAGTFDVEVRATLPRKEDADQDSNRENDVYVHHLHVQDQTIKVLLADYNLRHESWFLKNLLVRESRHPGDPRRIDAQVFIQSFDPDVEQPHAKDLPPLHAFPSIRKDLFAYDVIVLGDVYWRTLGSTEDQSKEILTLLKEFVAEGGGIAFVAGTDRSPTAFSDTPLQDLLPVFVRPSDRALEAKTDRPFFLTPTEIGAQHPILSVVPDATSDTIERLWREDRGWQWYWMYHAKGGLKPGAYALAQVYGVTGEEWKDERMEALPIFSAMSFGKGRVFFSAIDQIYRIRKENGDQYYGSFWDETIRWLATYRLQGGNKRFKILTDKEQYFVGDRAIVTVSALDPDYRPMQGPFTGLQVEDPRGHPMLVAPGDQPKPDDEAVPGLFRTEIRLPQSGPYRITVGPPGRDRAEKRILAKFVTAEDQDTVPDHETLREVVRKTNPSTEPVRLLAPWEILKLPDTLPSRTTERVLDRQEIMLWDTWWTLALATVLLGLEWLLRKRVQMI